LEDYNNIDLNSKLFESGVRVISEKGTLRSKPIDSFAIVFAEGWPSFTLVLQSLGIKVDTFLSETILDNDLILQKLFYKLPKLMKEFEVDLHSTRINTTVWIQGSLTFVESLLPLATKHFKHVILLHPKIGRKGKKLDTPGLNLTQGDLSHPAVGGITLSRWSVYTPAYVDQSSILVPSLVPRKLKHILNHTVKGLPFGNAILNSRKRKLGEDKPYLGEDRIIPGKSNITVVTHCVKQCTTPKIKRLLTPKELLDVYDIQTCHQDTLLQYKPSTIESVTQRIVEAAPEKVTFRIVDEIYKNFKYNLNSKETNSNLKSSSKSTSELNWMKEDKEDEVNDQKAARNDNAAIEISQWNWYLMKSYNPDYQLKMIARSRNDVNEKWKLTRNTKAKICTTIIPSTKHLRLLDQLRVASGNRFSRNVFLGFSSFMRNKYTSDLYPQAIDIYNSKKGNKRSNLLRKLFKSQLLESEFVKDYSVGREAVIRACKSSFWDWDNGSSLFFWRWPYGFRREARDGTRCYVNGKLPRYKLGQRWPKDPDICQKMKDKWMKVINREYIKFGPVLSLTGSFPVPKGQDDLRMVYDASKCGLNSQLWAPNFMLPTIDMTLRHVDQSGWFGDIDLGEMFLNFPLDINLRPYVGIDVSDLRDNLKELDNIPRSVLENRGRLFLRWERCLMGLRSSPFNACKAMGWADDIIRGEHLDPLNIFRWDRFILNLPGMKSYDPSLPKGYKWNDDTQSIAGNFEHYVDDIRSSHSTEEGCVLASRRIAATCNYLGIQDAARKRHFPSRKPRVWCGAKTATDDKGLYTCTTQVKWDRGKKIIQDWLDELDNSEDNTLLRKPMLSGRGFLVHLSRTYPALVPFMKGVHHTLESWRRGRSADGWKFTRDEWRAFLGDISEVKKEFELIMNEYLAEGDKDAPLRVKAVKRLRMDLNSMLKIMESPTPPLRLIRGPGLAYVLYGFGDASGAGFGLSWESSEGTRYRFGVWGKDTSGRSSNYRELKNLVDSLFEISEEQKLRGTEVYFFTDNSTAENAYFKGASTSELLHDLVTRLRQLEMTEGCKIILVHVSGERMKLQGSDGLSRGNLLEGVMTGNDILSYIPLSQTALSRSPNLERWIRSWAEDLKGCMVSGLKVLDENDWFIRGHDIDGGYFVNEMYYPQYTKGIYLWSPPPAAAEIACEEIRKARSKRDVSTHIFICPRLLAPYWRSHLHRAADLIFEIPAGGEYWPLTMHEPLILAIFFPRLPHRPWQLRQSPAIVELGDRLQRMWRLGIYSQGPILRKLREQARLMEHMQPRVVFEMLHCFGKLGVPCKGGQKRSRGHLEEEERHGEIYDCKRR
jgi:hypothetical protein